MARRKKLGNQNPTQSVILKYVKKRSLAKEAIDIYQRTGLLIKMIFRRVFNEYLIPYEYETMELVPGAPQEAIEARDEYLKWREDYQRTRSTFEDY